MSPFLHYEIARAHQQEIVSRAINSHRRRDIQTTTGNRHRSVKHRIGQVVAALCVCVAAGTAVTVSDAHSNRHPTKGHAGHLSAQQLAREIRAFEAKGYVPTSCTVSGTLMRDYSTGQSVTIKW
jgi:hypothetical protein